MVGYVVADDMWTGKLMGGVDREPSSARAISHARCLVQKKLRIVLCGCNYLQYAKALNDVTEISCVNA